METVEAWDFFKTWIEKLAESFRAFEPGCDYTLAAIINAPKDEHAQDRERQLEPIFNGLPVEFSHYHGTGCDVGGAQWYAETLTENAFMVCTTSRVDAFRPNWLRPLVNARNEFGEGLFTTMISRERSRLHA